MMCSRICFVCGVSVVVYCSVLLSVVCCLLSVVFVAYCLLCVVWVLLDAKLNYCFL